MTQFMGIILAAGMGKRMKNSRPKVLHTILGKPMIQWVIEGLLQANIHHLVVVISPEQQSLQKFLTHYAQIHSINVQFAYQSEPLGTGHAVQCALPHLPALNTAHVLIAFGDTPAVSPQSFQAYLSHHITTQSDATLLAFTPASPTGYGRIIMHNNTFIAIREEKDCSPQEKAIPLCNSGFLLCKYQDLCTYVPRLQNKNAAQEYYLTDVPALMAQDHKRISVFSNIPPEELYGVNSQQQLAQVSYFMQQRIIQRWMDEGVQFIHPHTVYVEDSVVFEPGVIVEPFVYLAGQCYFPAHTIIKAYSKIIDGVLQT